ncbi:MAG: hypothetical protein J0L64_06470 [Acidobacteria bacterium]|nr:hypothetical protein [Acidobacteriota bacterium]
MPSLLQALPARLALAAALPLMLSAQAPPPRLFFSDLDWGPKAGWEQSSTQGAAVTIWGKNLGASRGANFVSACGVQLNTDSDYAEWGILGPARGLERITFWLNSSMTDGSCRISVNVDGVSSNELPFTITSGRIYFVSGNDGNNANSGLSANQDAGANGPFKDIFMFDPTRNTSGDGQYIIYVRGGVYTNTNSDGAFTSSKGAGGPSKRKALIAYPGETPVLSNARIWHNGFQTNLARNSYFTFSKLTGTGGSGAFTTQWGDYNRYVGLHLHDYLTQLWAGVLTPVNSTENVIYGNLFARNGYDSMKHDLYIQTLDGFGAPSQNIDIGWNEIDSPTSKDRGASLFVSSHGTSPNITKDIRIHDNYFHGGNSNFIYMADSDPIGRVDVFNNIFANSTDATVGAVLMNVGASEGYLYNNTFYQAAAASVPLVQEYCKCKMVLTNNILYARSGQPFFWASSYYGGTLQSSNDLYYSPSGAAPTSGGAITRTGSLQGNPLFVDAAQEDFRLQDGSPALGAGASVPHTWDYDGAAISPALGIPVGAFTIGGVVAPPEISISLTPSTGSVEAGESIQLNASLSGALDASVDWSLSPQLGTISDTGLYTAPSSLSAAQTVLITATSRADATKSATAQVTVQPVAVPVSITVNPVSASLNQGQTRQFTAAVSGSANTAVTWKLGSAVGTITSTGLYIAPSTISAAQAVTVTATSAADPSKSASAVITLNPPAVPLSVSVQPTSVSLSPGQTFKFTAQVSGAANTAVTWKLSAAIGSVSSTGLYTATASTAVRQVVSVIATSVADPTKSALATVTINPPVVAVSISVSPSVGTVEAAKTLQFLAQVNGASDTGVTWKLSAAVGAISATGLYTAPSTVSARQSVTVTATSKADATKSASATLTVNPSASTGLGPTISYTVSADGTITMTWSASVTKSASYTPSDYITFTAVGAPDWWYVNLVSTKYATTGTATFKTPANLGLYEFRYYRGGVTGAAARSALLAVRTTGFSVQSAVTTVAAGQQFNVSWTAPSGRPTGWSGDWVGLYLVGAPTDKALLHGYLWKNSGAMSLKAPSTPGTYELRYVTNSGYASAAYSAPFTVK